MKTPFVSYHCTRAEKDAIHQVVARLVALCALHGRPIGATQQLAIELDITACHCNGRPLNLAMLATLDDAALLLDVTGIREHIDRRTGRLQGDWEPHCALPLSALVNPWGNPRDGYLVTATDQIDAVKGMGLDRLFACLAWPGNRDTVDAAIRRAIAKFCKPSSPFTPSEA